MGLLGNLIKKPAHPWKEVSRSKMNLKTFLKKVKAAEPVFSMILGIVVVGIVGVILFNYFKNYSSVSQEPQEEMEGKIAEGEKMAALPARYTVVENDSLWKISEKFYGSGYNWVDISKENKLANPNQIYVGQELVIPNVPVRQPELITTPSVKGEKIEGNQYVVAKGDTLWEISVRAYQDGYKWPEIAKANKLANPNLIHAGNVLVIPR